MPADNIPEDVKQFLLKSIDSIAQWEGLLLLQARPEKAWDVTEVAQNLYLLEADAARLLAALEALGMIKTEPTPDPALYRYEPRAALDDVIIKRAAELYKQSVIPITKVIHSKSKSRVQAFADAFRIRKD
jgi:predicted transcriptional regulator